MTMTLVELRAYDGSGHYLIVCDEPVAERAVDAWRAFKASGDDLEHIVGMSTLEK